MTDIVPSRNQIQQEETRFRSSVSESMLTRVGAGINFINTVQYDTHSWHLNGGLNLFPVSSGPDGIFPFLFDMQIVGFSYFIGSTVGASGSAIVDVHRLTGGGTDAGSIFSTRPQISSSAASNSYTTFRVTDSDTLQLPTGHTLAILSQTELDAGDALRLDLDQRGAGFRNFQLSIHYRPR